MNSISEVKRLHHDLIAYLKMVRERKGYYQVKEECIKILNFETIKELNDYSKELIALSLEKYIVLSMQKKNKNFWREININEPMIKDENHNLENHLNFFVRDLYTIFPNDGLYYPINKFYDLVILDESKKIGNRLIKLPSGEKVSVNEIYGALSNTLNKTGIDLEEVEYKVTKTMKKTKNYIYAGALIATIATVLLNSKKEKVEVIEPEVSIETEYTSDYAVPYEGISAPEAVIEETNEFIGYDCACPIEYQKIMYDMSEKYNVPFNIIITIADNESNSNFNTNGVISSTNDYGLCQINSCNFKYINEQLGYSKDEILNEPEKNIESCAFLLSEICSRFQNEIDNNKYINVFGTYNGWLGWHSKSISIDYANSAVEKISRIYNKSNEELFSNYEKGERHGK